MTRSLQAQPGTDRDANRTDATPGTGTGVAGLDRLRVVMAAAMGTVLVTYALGVPVAALLTATGGASLTADGAFAAAIPLWLAAHQIPLALEGRPLGVLPLLPTLLVVLVVAWAARWTVRRLGANMRHDAGVVVTSLGGAHAAVAVLGSALLPATAAVSVAPWPAMVGAGLVTAAAAGIGVLAGAPLPDEWRATLRGWPAAAGAVAAVGAAGLALLGALVVLAGLGFGAARAAATYTALGGGWGAALGTTLLALAYLPNAVVAGAAWALGPGVGIGLGAWTPFGGAPGPLPPFPLLAALPTVPSPVWAVTVVVAPALLGLLAGWTCCRVLGPASTVLERLQAVALGVGLLAAATAVACVLAGGRLAAGPYDPVSITGWLTGLAVLLWIGGPAALLAVLQRGVEHPEGYQHLDDDEDRPVPPGRYGRTAPSAVGEPAVDEPHDGQDDEREEDLRDDASAETEDDRPEEAEAERPEDRAEEDDRTGEPAEDEWLDDRAGGDDPADSRAEQEPTDGEGGDGEPEGRTRERPGEGVRGDRADAGDDPDDPGDLDDPDDLGSDEQVGASTGREETGAAGHRDEPGAAEAGTAPGPTRDPRAEPESAGLPGPEGPNGPSTRGAAGRPRPAQTPTGDRAAVRRAREARARREGRGGGRLRDLPGTTASQATSAGQEDEPTPSGRPGGGRRRADAARAGLTGSGPARAGSDPRPRSSASEREPRPRTVGELVALRARQAEQAARNKQAAGEELAAQEAHPATDE